MMDRKQLTFLLVGLAVALVLAGIVSFYASSSPDGLEKVAEDKGFIDTATQHATGDGPLADYGVSGVDNERLSGGLAGVIGVGLTVVIAGGLFLGLRAVRRRTEAGGDRPPTAVGGAPGR
ncbi:MAG: PDGLE domain-containing protein [Acidimicrobiales bacterium]